MVTPFLPLALLLLGSALGAQQIKEFKFEVKTLGGATVKEQAFNENVLIVDIWGTWCPPCREAVPVLQDLYKRYKHHGLEIVGLNYESKSDEESARIVRKFAAEQGITYTLALGTPAIQRQIPKFSGYPTLLFFNKGLVFDHMEVGFDKSHKQKMDAWVKTALGLEAGTGEKVGDAAKPEEEVVEPEPAPPEREPLPKGVIFKPGDGDTGFEFEAQDIDGKTVKLAELRGKPVLLVMTSTWDGEAANTAKLINKLHAQHGADVHVLAASLEMKKAREENVATIKAFAEKNAVKYRVFPAGLGFQKKIHLFTGMPLFLLFDKEGTLHLREGGASYEKIETAINDAIAALAK